MVESIHIHEDNWGMRNLYPLAAREDAASDIKGAKEASERNKAPDGPGWTDVHMIEAPSISYIDVGLSLTTMSESLARIMPRVKLFAATTGSGFGAAKRDPWGYYAEEAWCFGLSDNCFIKLEPGGDLVRDIWYELYTDEAAPAAAMRTAIAAVDRLAPSYIADYWLRFAGPADAEGLDTYFALLTQRQEGILGGEQL